MYTEISGVMKIVLQCLVDYENMVNTQLLLVLNAIQKYRDEEGVGVKTIF